MNLSLLEKKLIGAARSAPPSESVPYAFEQRMMARIRSHPPEDVWALWASALWRGAGACLAVVVVMGAVAVFFPADGPVRDSADFVQDFQRTMLAEVDQDFDFSQ